MLRPIHLILAAALAISPALAHGGFGGGPPMGAGGPPMGIGGGPPVGIGGPGDFGRGANPPGLGRRPDTPPGQDVSALVRGIGRDAVGRPADPQVRAAALERDDQGAPVVRGEVLAISPTDADLAVAEGLHFTVVRRDDLDSLGISSVTLRAPQGMTAVRALAVLRAADPGGNYDYAHIYNPSGGVEGPATGVVPASVPAEDVTVGMIDGGIEKHHGALKRADIDVRSFTGANESVPTVHGTAIASLLVGHDAEFTGYLPGASLYAADVFGGSADGGSAVSIARALDWLAAKHVAVANVSLTGPSNALLAAAVKAFIARGHVLVAAVGNDGPAAPPNYPASYPGVIAVTSVDSSRRLELDANRARSGFAALGVGVRAASLPDGYGSFTGTSYATPAVTSRFALLVPKPDPTEARAAVDALARACVRIDGSVCLIGPAAGE